MANTIEHVQYVGTGAQLDVVCPTNPKWVLTYPREAGSNVCAYHPSLGLLQGLVFGTSSSVIASPGGFVMGLLKFTVGTSANINTLGVTYDAIVFTEDLAQIRFVTWVGDGSDPRDITVAVGFEPDIVIVAGDAPVPTLGPLLWCRSKGGDNSWGWGNAGQFGFAAGRVKGTHANGFTIGSNTDVNQAGKTYYGWAIKRKVGFIFDGAFTGDGSDNRNIVMADPFQAEFLFGWRPLFAWNNWARNPGHAGDQSFLQGVAAPVADYFQAINANGFQVGASFNQVASGAMQYIAMKGDVWTAPAVVGGTQQFNRLLRGTLMDRMN